MWTYEGWARLSKDVVGRTVQLARQKGLLGVILFMKALTGFKISLLNSGTGSCILLHDSKLTSVQALCNVQIASI